MNTSCAVRIAVQNTAVRKVTICTVGTQNAAVRIPALYTGTQGMPFGARARVDDESISVQAVVCGVFELGF